MGPTPLLHSAGYWPRKWQQLPVEPSQVITAICGTQQWGNGAPHYGQPPLNGMNGEMDLPDLNLHSTRIRRGNELRFRSEIGRIGKE